jgi:hypothetical protein
MPGRGDNGATVFGRKYFPQGNACGRWGPGPSLSWPPYSARPATFLDGSAADAPMDESDVIVPRRRSSKIIFIICRSLAIWSNVAPMAEFRAASGAVAENAAGTLTDSD